MLHKLRQRLATSLFAFGALLGSAQASMYSDLVFFGDSLSDTGNVLSLTTAFSPPPFPSFPAAPGRFSNGPVWTEHLAQGLGLAGNAAPSNLLFAGAPGVIPIGAQGGQNFSFGGARTGLDGSAGPTTGLSGQLIAWNGSVFNPATGLTRAADPGALYVVLAGANDLRDARTANPGATAGDAAARTAAAQLTAGNVSNAIGLLAQAGARHFLVSSLPDLGLTPEATTLGNVAASTDVTLKFNAALAAAMAALDALFLGQAGIDLDIRALDFFGLSNSIHQDAVGTGSVYGISNVTAPCIAPVAPGAYFVPGSVDLNCAVSAFSDDLHPSAAVHRLLGQLAVATAVPEPGSLVLVALALTLLVGRGRRAPLARLPSGRY
ncbi:MAG TPA: SGNH/GDSL hydrolase family protein [Candidatus Accumulibacter phosphatis]|nr:MAG: Esterase EstA precursor [Candidatus Accumulibacter sp. SK-11]HRL77520.1 SGNH/GDSL hydrolase family protein [Candidatus Accumulibacter phosphatis]HRQ96132.1 SGNH/GDSL hydrolase family protein [Candidatus Accumulibacter phosphatis]